MNRNAPISPSCVTFFGPTVVLASEGHARARLSTGGTHLKPEVHPSDPRAGFPSHSAMKASRHGVAELPAIPATMPVRSNSEFIIH